MCLCLQQPLPAGGLDEAREPLGLRGARSKAERGDPEESRPAASGPGTCGRIDLDNELELDEAREIPVQHRRPQPHPAAGALEHLGHDAETVQLAIGEGEKDLKPVRFECGRSGPGHVYLFRYIHGPKGLNALDLSRFPAR